MTKERKELNHQINRLYRQLGKKVYEDLQKNQLNIKTYQGQKEMIETYIAGIKKIDGDKEIVREEKEPVMSKEGIPVYKFCPVCHVGNHPEAVRCSQCQAQF